MFHYALYLRTLSIVQKYSDFVQYSTVTLSFTAVLIHSPAYAFYILDNCNSNCVVG